MKCREPEKGAVFDWRAKLKEEEKDNDPKNMWKKFDAAGPMKVTLLATSFGKVFVILADCTVHTVDEQ